MNGLTLLYITLVGFVLAVACGPPASTPAAAGRPTVDAPPAVAASRGATTEQEATQPSRAVPTPTPMVDGRRLLVSAAGWKTDFTKATVPLDEIMSGGPPRDGIPPIDVPKFVPPSDAGAWLKDHEPVVAFALGSETRAYPLQILMWHEIVNDEVAGTPVAITFCPLCNAAIAFDRRVQGFGAMRFGTTGNLRHSDLVMWDDRTESWWQQITGEAIVGQLAGTKLRPLPASIVAFRDFKASFPHGQVLSRDTGYSRNYGSNPYVGYDDINDSPFLFRGAPDGRLRPMERVAAVELDGETVAYPFSALEQRGVVHDAVGGTPIVVFWARGTASALDQSQIASGRDIGASGVFLPSAENRGLTFVLRDSAIVDRETGSTWNVLGQASAGPLAGKRLERVQHGDYFWFVTAVTWPHVRIWSP